jgi:hypothetical protein
MRKFHYNMTAVYIELKSDWCCVLCSVQSCKHTAPLSSTSALSVSSISRVKIFSFLLWIYNLFANLHFYSRDFQPLDVAYSIRLRV